MLLRDSGAEVTVTGTKPDSVDYFVDLSGMNYRRPALNDPADPDRLAASFASLDILVNNAGVNFPGGLNESTADGFAASVGINLLAPFRPTVALGDALKASQLRGGASVVMLVSMAAIRTVAMVPGCGVAKRPGCCRLPAIWQHSG